MFYFSLENSEHHHPESRNLQGKYYWGDQSFMLNVSLVWLPEILSPDLEPQVEKGKSG